MQSHSNIWHDLPLGLKCCRSHAMCEMSRLANALHVEVNRACNCQIPAEAAARQLHRQLLLRNDAE